MTRIPQSRTIRRAFVCLFCAVLFQGGAQNSSTAEDKSPPISKSESLKLLKTFQAEFVKITPGTGKFPGSFQMGSAKGPRTQQPLHSVTFSSNFSIAKYEVPQDLYKAVMGSNPSVWGGPRNSCEMMTWSDAVQFCRKATLQMRQAELIKADEEIRLPTEAEWEYCCRAGTTTTYSFGDSATTPEDVGKRASRLDPYGWHTGNASGNDPPIGALKPNAWGLYDMHGYLWEYVSDAWHIDYAHAPADETSWDGDKTQTQRVIRGGSWRDHYENLQSGTRWATPDHVRSDAIGFRCVKATVKQ